MVLCCLCLTDKTRNPPSSQHTSEIDNKKRNNIRHDYDFRIKSSKEVLESLFW